MVEDKRQIAIDKVTAGLIEHLSQDGKKRDGRFYYITTFDGVVEMLLIFAVDRIKSEWKSRDKYREGKELLAACTGDRPLTPLQKQLLEQALKKIQVGNAPTPQPTA